MKKINNTKSKESKQRINRNKTSPRNKELTQNFSAKQITDAIISTSEPTQYTTTSKPVARGHAKEVATGAARGHAEEGLQR